MLAYNFLHLSHAPGALLYNAHPPARPIAAPPALHRAPWPVQPNPISTSATQPCLLASRPLTPQPPAPPPPCSHPCLPQEPPEKFDHTADLGAGPISPGMIGQREEDYARLYAWVDQVGWACTTATASQPASRAREGVIPSYRLARLLRGAPAGLACAVLCCAVPYCAVLCCAVVCG